MSAIFGIFNRNGKPVDQDSLVNMQTAISYWGPDDCRTWSDGPAALGHAMLWNTPESRLESLPRKDNHLAITMDARLDNREELASRLGLGNSALNQITNSELILAAYSKWREECPNYLLGDFTFAIWDQKEQLLFIARDHIGIKQIYYFLDDEKILLSNDIKALSSFPGVLQNINSEAVAIYLTFGELWHPSFTFFQSIEKIPPANSKSVTSNKTIEKTYWKVENCPEIKFNKSKDYSDRLRDLLEDSVQKRIKSEWPIASHLSGGLDSSAIATIAARHLLSQGNKLHAFNWVPQPSSEDDADHFEWANSRRVAELEKIDHHYIEFNTKILHEILMNHDIRMNDTVDLWYEFVVRKEAHKKNVRTILSGWGGDELISYDGGAYHGGNAYIADLFWNGKIFKALIQISNRAKNDKRFIRRFFAGCYYDLLAQIAPNWLRRILPRVSYRRMDYLQFTQREFHNFARSNHATVHKTLKTMRDHQIYAFSQGHLTSRVESWASSAFKYRMEYCYPLLDLRVVEFALGVPSSLYYQQGQKRFLFRQAVQGLLPEDLRQGHFKLELNRVRENINIGKNAAKLWLDEFEAKKPFQPNSYYIDYPCLKEKIISRHKATTDLSTEEIQEVEGIISSIFVLGLG